MKHKIERLIAHEWAIRLAAQAAALFRNPRYALIAPVFHFPVLQQ